MSDYEEMAKLIRERKGDAMERAAVELFQYFRALVAAGFTKKQAIKIVMAAVRVNGKR